MLQVEESEYKVHYYFFTERMEAICEDASGKGIKV